MSRRMVCRMLAVCGTLLAVAAAAAEEPAQEHALEEVVVTAPGPQPEPNPVTPLTTRYATQHNLVTKEQIEEQNGSDFQSALRNVPGVMFQSKNLMGSQTSHSLYIRGRGANHPSADFAVEFDGAPHYGALFGQVLGDGIAPSTIGGIQVFKSPQPVQFGSGYASVNILPKFMTEEGEEVVQSSNGGSYATVNASLSGGIKRGAYDIYVSQSWASTDGHVDHSRAQQQSYYVNLGYRLNREWNVRFLSNYVTSQTLAPRPEVTPTAANGVSWPGAERYDTETVFSTLTLNHQYEQATGYLKGYWNQTDFDLLQELTNGKRYAGVSGGLWSRQAIVLYGLRGKETLHLWSGGEVVVGTDLDHSELTNAQRTYSGLAAAGINGGLPVRNWDYPQTTLVSPYFAVSQQFGQAEGFHVTPSTGFRYFAHNEFKDVPSYQAGLVTGYGRTDLNLSYARGVNYPTQVVLANMVLASAPVADPSQYWSKLKPEVVDHYEVGLTHAWPALARAAVTAFFDRGKDRFQAYMFGGIPTTFNDTVGRYEIRGLEVTGTLTPVQSLELFAAATWLDAEATGSNGVKRDRMPYTPAFQLQAGATWSFLKHFKLYTDLQYLQDVYAGTSARSGTFNFAQITDGSKLGDVTVMNARLSYHFSYTPWRLADSELFVSVNNLLNQSYEYAKGYSMPETTFFGGFSLKFR